MRPPNGTPETRCEGPFSETRAESRPGARAGCSGLHAVGSQGAWVLGWGGRLYGHCF